MPPLHIDLTGCAGCEYDPSPSEAEMVVNTYRDTVHRVSTGELYDLERMNFLGWYRTATLKDLAVARKNNSAKLDELKKKYASEIELMDIVGRWTC